jgi:derlin-1
MVKFFFGVTFKAQYLPWVLCLFNMIVKGGGMLELLGIFVGHIYFFLKFRYAQDFGGPDLLQTPQVIMKFILLWKKVELGS